MKYRTSACRPSILLRSTLLALALGSATPLVLAQNAFTAPDTSFSGRLSPRTQLIYAGDTVELAGDGYKPGQKITLLRGSTVLNAQPYVADAEGKFKASLQVPADAAVGRHPLLVHQSAYSAKNNVLFVTAAVGRPPVKESELVKVSPKTLKVLARATPAVAPPPPRADGPGRPAPEGAAPRDGGVYAVYGIGVDDANGNVWVTNTRQNTVAVYRQADLALVKQFPAGTVAHPRDVIIDAKHGKAYVSAGGQAHVAVFDAASLTFTRNIEISSGKRGEKFTPMSLALDADSDKLFSVSISSPEAVVINTASDSVEKVLPLRNAVSASGVAWDAGSKRLLVVSQGSDNLLIVDPVSGQVEHDVAVGAGALNVAVDPVSGLAYVSNRASGNVAVVDRNGKLVANLAGGTFPNHVHADGKGAVYAVNKSRGKDDPEGDRITRIVAKAK
jgi:DNA-binding beta-propeller fold protein YncE